MNQHPDVTEQAAEEKVPRTGSAQGMPEPIPAWSRYAVAILIVAAAAAVRLAFLQTLGMRSPFLTFYPAVMLAALYGGMRAGWLATILSACLANFAWIEPVGSFLIKDAGDLLSLVIFILSCALISWITGAMQRAEARATEAEARVKFARDPEQLDHAPSASDERLAMERLKLIFPVNAVFGVALAILLVVAWIGHRNTRAMMEIDRWEAHTHVVIEELDGLLSTLKDAETGQRGFLITGEEEYLEPYLKATSQVEGEVLALKNLTRDNPAQQKRLQEIEPVISGKLAQMRETINARRKQGFEAAQHLVFNHIGKARMDEIRNRVGEMKSEEHRLLQERAREKNADLRAANQTGVAGGILGFALLGLSFVFLRKEITLRAKVQGDLKAHQDHLEELVKTRTVALRESEEHFRTMANAMPQLAWTARPDGHIFWYNQRWYEYTGTTPEQMEGWGWQSVHDAVELPKVIERWKASIATGEPFEMTFPLRGADGIFRMFLTRGHPSKDAEGRVLQWFGTNTDVTDQLRAQQSEERYHTLFDTLIEGFCIIEMIFDDNGCPVDYRFLEINPAFEKQTGLHDAQGKLMRDLAPDHETHWFEIYGKVALTGEPARFVNEASALNRWYDVSAYRVGGSESRRVAILFNDITEARRAEAALQANRERLELALISSRMATFDWDIVKNKRSWSQGVHELLGTNPESFTGTPEEFFRVIHREDRDTVQAALARALETGQYQTEYRAVWPDGSIRNICARGRVHRDDTGQPALMTAVCWDVTEDRKKENELQRLNRTLTALRKSSQAITRATQESEFMEEICKILTEDCGHKMVWIGFAEQDAEKTVRPVASAGFEEGYLDTIKISWGDTERGRGPTGTAIRTGKPSHCRNMLTDPAFTPWRAEAMKRGYSSSMVLPLLKDGKAFGAVTVYSVEPDPFLEEEMRLMGQLANDLAQGLTNIRIRAAHARAEEALRLSEKRYRGLVEVSPDAIFVNRNNHIEYVNSSALRLFGVSCAEQILGKTPFELFHPDYHAVIRERIALVLAGKSVPPMEFKVINARGEVVEVEGVATQFHEQDEVAIQVILRDITFRKRAEEQTFRLAAIVQNADDAIVGKSLDGIVTSWNNGAEKLYGYSAEEAIGKHIAILLAPDDELGETAILEKIRLGGHVEHYETVRRRKDRQEVQISLTVSPIYDARGCVVGASAISRDITERKRIEEQNRGLTEEMRRRSAELSASNKELEAFAYSVSHDLRTPLRGIDGFSQALSEDYGDKLDAAGKDQLQRIRAAAQRMAKLIDDLLALSRVGRLDMNRQEVDLSALARVVAAELQASDRSRKADFLIVEGMRVNGDAQLLRIVLENLLGNAWKFTGRRTQAIIEFGLNEQEGEPVFFIRDNGAGFNSELAAGKLFGVFQRMHKTSDFPGTGVGLATVERIIRRHGGRVWAQSEVDRGATFRFTL